MICRTLAVLMVLALPSLASADFQVVYDFAPLTGITPSVSPTITGSDLIGASSLVRGLGLTPESGTGGFNASGWTTAATPDPTDYFEFTLGATAGAKIFTSFEFTGRLSATGPLDILISASTDGFLTQTGIVRVTRFSSTSTNNFRVAFPDAYFDLFNGQSSAISFRFYGYNAVDSAGMFLLGKDPGSPSPPVPNNLIVSGRVVAVPEPSSVVLAGLGLADVVIMARRRLAA